MPFGSINQYLNRKGVALRVRVEVLKDDAVTWLDLTDRISFDRLASLPGLTNRQERTLGAAEVSLSTLRMDNRDRFWNGAPPAGIASWFRRKVRVSIVTAGGTSPLGLWLIDDLDTGTDEELATLALVTLSKRLIDKEADRARNGRDWFVNRNIGFLVRKLLLCDFTLAEVNAWGDILTRYQIPLANPLNRAVSAYGKPPEFDGTVWREDSRTLYGSPYACVNASASAHYGKHWMGIGGELWRWDPETDVWTKWAGMPSGRTAFQIFHVYVNATRNKVVCVAWEVDAPSAALPSTATGDRSGAKNGDVAILWADMTTAPSVLQEFAGKPANIWTGHYAVRAGHTNAGVSWIGAPVVGSADAACFGINCPVPVGHWTRWGDAGRGSPPAAIQVHHKTGFNTKADTTDQGPASLDGTIAWGIDSAGYYAPNLNMATAPMDFRWSLGQFRGAFALQNTGDDFLFTVVSWDGATARYRFRLWKANTNTGVFTDSGLWVMTGNEHLQPYSFEFRADDAKVLCAAVQFRETAWAAGAPTIAPNEPFSSAVIEFAYPLVDSGAPAGRPTQFLPYLNTNHVAGSNPELYWVIWYDARYGGTDYAIYTGIDVRNVLGANAFTSVTQRITTLALGNRIYSAGRIAGAVYEAATGKFYVHDSGPNQVRSVSAIGVTLATDFWGFEDSGFPPVAADPSLLMGLVADKKHGAIFGVSGPGSGIQANPEVINKSPLSGKYYLWQLAGWLTDRVELADFSGLKVWEALEELAGLMDGVFGFNRAGEFYFKARPAPSAIVATLATDAREDEGRVPDCAIQLRAGFRKIYNMAEVTPSIAVLREASATIRVLPRPAAFGRAPWNAAPELFQANNRNLNVLLRCVEGGQIGSPDNGCVYKTLAGNAMVDYSPGAAQQVHRLRFGFLLYDTVVETQLIALVTTVLTDTIRIPLEAAKDVRPPEAGVTHVQSWVQTDEITIGDTELYTVRARTDDSVAGTCDLRLDRAITTAWAVGTRLTIRTRGNNRWSDHADGVTWSASLIGASSVGALETINVLSTRDLAAGMVIRFDYNGLEDMRIEQVVDATTIKVRRGCGGTQALAHSVFVPVRAYWAPIVSAQYPSSYRFDVGGTGVSMRFNALPDAGDNPFMVGDTIEIVCPGLRLEKQEKAKIIAYNVPAIEKLGGSKIPWPSTRDLRFAGYRQAVETGRRVVTQFGSPHFEATVNLSVRWLPDINEAYLLEDLRGVLPHEDASSSPNGDNPPVAPDSAIAVAAVVEGYNIDILNDRLSVDVRAVNPHSW